jgi:hypothetical protein
VAGAAVAVACLMGLPAGSFAVVGSAASPQGPALPSNEAAHPTPNSGPTRLPEIRSPAPSVEPVPPKVRLGRLHLPGPHPAAWGASAIPPGAPYAAGATLPNGGALVPTASGLNNSWNNSDCAGLWPDGWGSANSQSKYVSGCYGHDEPGIEFYSDLPGSGGNVSWNITLPIDRSPTDQQGDLYVAIWFGLTLSDPYSWLHQCFLELQFYPDQSWTTYPADNNWIAAAVAWQIEAVNGYENPCVYSPLYLDGTNGASYLNMQGGDGVTVQLTGWAGDPAGEQILIDDHKNDERSTLYLYNSSASLPLDPAYATNSYENSLEWTPGGEFPVVFAFETGHATASWVPENNSYGGCSPGVPPPTPQDPATPCPSYDSSSWVNDTLAPWRIAPPTFFNATTRSTPAQVSFGQDFGGLALVDEISNGSCDGRDGSAWCSYPWYSYSCALSAFEFGATDYPGTTTDFGKYLEYGANAQEDGLRLGFYAPSNYTIPTCGSPSYTVNVSESGGGAVHFLAPSPSYGGTFALVGPGNYSVSADAIGGSGFTGWRTTGSVSITTPPDDPWANLWVQGNGSVEATFGSTPVRTRVTYDVPSGPLGADAVVTGGFLFSGAPPVAHLDEGGNADLPVGTYGIQAYPPPGWTFGGWEAGPGLIVAGAALPYTWLTITGTANASSLNASFEPTSGNVSVEFWVSGSAGGTISFDGIATSGYTTHTVTVGSYRIVATPNPGGVFAGWYAYGDGELSDQGENSTLAVEGASVELLGVFEDQINLTVTPSGDGAITANGAGPYESGSSTELDPGTYVVESDPYPGEVFAGWQSSDPAALWVVDPQAPETAIVVNDSAGLTLTLSTATTTWLRVSNAPSTGGTITFDGMPGYASSNTSLPVSVGGSYPIAAVADPGYTFSAWSTTGSATVRSSVAGPVVSVTGTNGTLTAEYAPERVPVSFVAAGVLSAIALINGTRLASDATVPLPPGTYPISLNLSQTVATFDGWAVTSNLSLNGTNLTVAGPGTLTALVAPFGLSAPTVAPSAIPWNATATFQVTAMGAGPFAYEWAGLPGCPSRDLSVLACRASEAGRFSGTVSVVDPDGNSATAGGANLTVDDAQLELVATASPNATDVGVATVLSVTPLDGLGPFTYRYTGLPVGCSSANLSTVSCLPTEPSSGSSVNVTDALGLSEVAPIALVVHPVPRLALANAAGWKVDAGISTTLTVLPRNGTLPYRFVWTGLPAGCSAVDGPSVRCVGPAEGAYPVEVELTDAVGVSVSVSEDLVIVPPLAVDLLTAQPNTTDVGRPVNFSVGYTGGVAPFTVDYVGLPNGCASVNASTFTCRPTAAIQTDVLVTVSDRDGISDGASTPVVIDAAPFLRSVAIAPLKPVVGQPMTIEATAGGGTPPWTFAFTGLPDGCAPVAAPPLTCAPKATGSFSIRITATDSVGGQANATLAITVAPSSSPAASNELAEVAIGGAVAAVAAVALGLWVRRRRRTPPREPDWSHWPAGEDPDGPAGLPADETWSEGG